MDGVTYSTLMNLYVDSGDTKGAERILDRMASQATCGRRR